MIFLITLLAFMVSAGLTWRFCNPQSRFHLLDHPNERSLHSQPIPRSGGVAVLAGILAGVAGTYALGVQDPILCTLILSAAPVAIVSFADDCHGVKPGVRLLAHVLSVVMLFWISEAPLPLKLPDLWWASAPAWTIPGLALFVVWMINLYNFMDGMDGLAAGMTIIGFTGFAVLGWQAGQLVFTGASLVVVGASVGFLVFNFPPARIFLGDTGSSTLGFLAAAFSLWGQQDAVFPLWIAILLFSPFSVDATVTLGRRLLRGEKVWQAHKTHYYQRLVQLGWGHRGTLLAEALLMVLCGLSALLAIRLASSVQLGLLGAWVLLYACLIRGVGCLERRYGKLRTS